MTTKTCPVCGKPYIETVSTDRTRGTFEEPLLVERERQQLIVCYDVSAYPEAYHGFTLYYHEQSYYVAQEKWADGEWQDIALGAKRNDVMAALDDRRPVDENQELRITKRDYE